MSAKAYTGKDSMEFFYLRSPVDLYNHSFELFSAECIVYLTCLIGFIHAKRNGSTHLLFFLISFLAASLVDPYCLISEEIRNYYHSHASILMFDRHVAPWQFPLFACIAYVPGAAVWSLGLGLVSETLLMVFVSSWSFYCFDLFACRWLLYQWHVSDPLYAAKTQCVPLASSMWVMTYAATASLLARYLKTCSLTNLVKGILIFLPLHIVPISVFYFPVFYLKLGLEFHVVWGFALVSLVLSVLMTVWGVEERQPRSTASMGVALLQTLVWFGGISFMLLRVDPHAVLSYSIHQPFASTPALCEKTERYLFGFGERKRYACKEDLQTWVIVPHPQTGYFPSGQGEEYYAIQGLNMDQEFFMHMAGSIGLGLFVQLFIFALARCGKSQKKFKQQ